MYAWLVSPIPRGVGKGIPQVDHQCNNAACCNPAHLELVSARYNSLRARRNPIVDNASKTHCVRGHALPDTFNDKRWKKRYCVECSREHSEARRHDVEHREYMKVYLKGYSAQLRYGPRRAELLEKARIASQIYRDSKRLLTDSRHVRRSIANQGPKLF